MSPAIILPKPEAALAKAKDFLKIGKQESALEILTETMKNRRQKIWTKTHEDLMLMLSNLCVELKKSNQFKETIHQYKSLTVQINPKTLEDVVRHYIEAAKEKTLSAREESISLAAAASAISSSALPDIDDLDVIVTPEEILLRAVCSDGSQDRQDRTVLTPWLKFLWESYRQTLDLLKNNSKFEKLYHDVAQDAYEFCITYERKTEFRKLCDILRTHMTKFQNQMLLTNATANQQAHQQQVNLANPDTQALHLETRLKQLDHALNLQLYNEAFKTVEDISSLLTISKASQQKPRILANYFLKAGDVFFQSGSCQLYHAAALHRHYFLYKEMKKSSRESSDKLTELANRALVATLAVPLQSGSGAGGGAAGSMAAASSLGNRAEQSEILFESGETSAPHKQKSLASLLRLPTPPTRASLLRDLQTAHVPLLVHPQLQRLYQVMEVSPNALSMASDAKAALEMIETVPELRQYAPLIKKALVAKTMLHICQVFKTVRLSSVDEMCAYMEPLQLQITLAELIRNLELPVRIDNRLDVMNIDELAADLGLERRGGAAGADQLVNEADITTGDSVERKTGSAESGLREMDEVARDRRLGNQLTAFGHALSFVVEQIPARFLYDPADPKSDLTKTKIRLHPSLREKSVNAFHNSALRTWRANLDRKRLIESRKEEIELYYDHLGQEMDKKRWMEEERRRKEEEKRLKQENERRDREKIETQKKNLEDRMREENVDMILRMNCKTSLAGMDKTQLKKLDNQEIIRIYVDEKKKEEEENRAKAAKFQRKLDYHWRALRLEQLDDWKKVVGEDEEKGRQLIANIKAERKKRTEAAKKRAERNEKMWAEHGAVLEAYYTAEEREVQTELNEQIERWHKECDRVREEFRKQRKAEILEEKRQRKEEEQRQIREEEEAAAEEQQRERERQEKQAEAEAAERQNREVEMQREAQNKPTRGLSNAEASKRYVLPSMRRGGGGGGGEAAPSRQFQPPQSQQPQSSSSFSNQSGAGGGGISARGSRGGGKYIPPRQKREMEQQQQQQRAAPMIIRTQHGDHPTHSAVQPNTTNFSESQQPQQQKQEEEADGWHTVNNRKYKR